MKIKTLTFLIVALLTACSSDKKKSDDTPAVSVSILPQKYLVEQIAGERFRVNVLLPPGASPATYEPTPSQLSSLYASDIYFKIGYTGFELAWMDKIAAANNDMKIYDISENVELIKNDDHKHHTGQSSVNPHIWLSPLNVRIMTENIYVGLSGEYPEYEKEFKENLHAFHLKLDSLDIHIRETLHDLKQKSFLIYHPALSYFSRDYHLVQYTMEREGKNPSAAYLKKLTDIGRQENIGVLFLQMQFDQHNAEVLAKEIGAKIVQINPLDEAWYTQMLYITEQLKSNLQ